MLSWCACYNCIFNFNCILIFDFLETVNILGDGWLRYQRLWWYRTYTNLRKTTCEPRSAMFCRTVSLPNPFHTPHVPFCCSTSHSTGGGYRNVLYTIADRRPTVVYHTTSSARHLQREIWQWNTVYSAKHRNTEIRLPRMSAKYFRFLSKTNSA